MLEWIAIGLLAAGVVRDLWRVRRLERRLDDFAGALLLVAQRAGAAARDPRSGEDVVTVEELVSEPERHLTANAA